mmetsp:Transcript_31100/g.103964  ORF Transcript_31100/g.103964 Transcript_31100/m.103964 type:complete len:230 (-) Transcript_31100:420-1109(-)
MILNLTPGTQSSGFAAEKADLGAPAASEAAALERDRLERRLRAAGTQREYFDSSLRQRVEAAATPPPYAGGARPFYSRAHDTRTGVAAGAAARAAVRAEWAASERQAARGRRLDEERACRRAKLAAARATCLDAAAAAEREREQAETEEARRAEARRSEALASIRAREEERDRTRAHKAVTMERYAAGRLAQLRNEAAQRRRPLPPLCACGLDALKRPQQPKEKIARPG